MTFYLGPRYVSHFRHVSFRTYDPRPQMFGNEEAIFSKKALARIYRKLLYKNIGRYWQNRTLKYIGFHGTTLLIVHV